MAWYSCAVPLRYLSPPPRPQKSQRRQASISWHSKKLLAAKLTVSVRFFSKSLIEKANLAQTTRSSHELHPA